MNALQFAVIGCLLAASTSATLAEGVAPDDPGQFANRIVVVRFGTQSQALANASLRTIGGRTFLVGLSAIETASNQHVRPEVAIAWDRVEMLTIFKSLQDFQRQANMTEVSEVPVELEIARLRNTRAELGPETQRHTRFIAQTEREIQNWGEKAAAAETERAKQEYLQKIRRRQAELSAIQKRLDELLRKKRQIKDQEEQLRHEEILRGRLID